MESSSQATRRGIRSLSILSWGKTYPPTWPSFMRTSARRVCTRWRRGRCASTRPTAWTARPQTSWAHGGRRAKVAAGPSTSGCSSEPRHLDPGDDELHRDGAQHQAHKPREDPHPRLAEPPLQPGGGGERHVAKKSREGDGRVYADRGHRTLRRPGEDHHGGDRAGPREHRDAEWHDPHIFLLNCLRLFDRRFLLLAAARLDHVERVQADQHAARDLERCNRDAEQTEDEAATESERRQGDQARPGASASHEATRFRRIARSHGEERWYGREGIDDEQDRRENQEQLLQYLHHARHIATWTTRSFPPCFAAYIA